MIDPGLLERLPRQTPRSTEALPGLTLSRALRGKSFALPVVFLLFFMFMPILVMTSDPHLALSWNAETATGHIDSITHNATCQPDSALIRYSFTDSTGAMFRGQSRSCDSGPYAGAQPGDAIPVRYAKKEPTNNEIAGKEGGQDPPWIFFVFFPLMGLLFFAPLFWPSISRIINDRKLFRTGALARGRVVFVSQRESMRWPGWPGTTQHDVYIQVEVAAGMKEVRAACGNDWLLQQLRAGAEVTVAYRPDVEQAALLENYLR